MQARASANIESFRRISIALEVLKIVANRESVTETVLWVLREFAESETEAVMQPDALARLIIDRETARVTERVEHSDPENDSSGWRWSIQ